MRAGELNRRVVIQSITSITKAADGQDMPNWTTDTGGTVWAKVKPLSGRQLEQARTIAATATHRVTIRYRTGVTTVKRLQLGTRNLYINAVLNEDERNEALILTCTERL